MEFTDWLQRELDKRSWPQSELLRRSKMAGYPISQAQLSRIVTGAREANPDVCIGIAHAFGISREEVFRARGWLLTEPLEEFGPKAEPRIVALNEKVLAWPPHWRETILEVIMNLANAVDVVGAANALEQYDD